MFTLLVVIALVALITVAVVYFAMKSGLTSRFPFPCLGVEGNAMHIHPWLRININGQPVTIPGNIGIVSTGLTTCFEPVHTHDTSGIIHIESPDTTTIYTLDDFFKIWNVTYQTVSFQGSQQPVIFSQGNILGFKADMTHTVTLLVDGASSAAYGSLNLNQLDYCNAANANVPPCFPTAPGAPSYPGGYPFNTNHTIVIDYSATA